MKISIDEARWLVVRGQLLASKQGNTIHSVVSALGGIQYDPNPILHLNHYLALWSRIPGFSVEHFDKYAYEKGDFVETSLYKRNLFIVPVSELDVYDEATRSIVRWGASREQEEAELLNNEMAECARQIKQAFREGGSCTVEELWERMGLADKWKEYRNGRKQGLLISFLPMFQVFFKLKYLNEVLVCNRLPGTFRQPVYNIREMLLHDTDKLRPSNGMEAVKWVIHKLIHSFGVTNESHIKSITGYEKGIVSSVFRLLQDDGRIAKITIDGIKKDMFAAVEHLKCIPKPEDSMESPVNLLSPMEGMIRDKSWLKTIFGYSFSFEYFKKKGMKWPLSILYGNEMFGFLDCKIDRKHRIFYVKELHITEGKNIPIKKINEAVHSLARFHNAKTLNILGNNEDRFQNTTTTKSLC